jgi:hypothetical protein
VSLPLCFADSLQLGTRQCSIEQGQTFGELALADASASRPETAIAGAAGAHLLIVDRALFQHFTSAATPVSMLEAGSGRLADSLRALCCRRMLAVPSASEHDVHALAAFLHGLEVCLSLQCGRDNSVG